MYGDDFVDDPTVVHASLPFTVLKLDVVTESSGVGSDVHVVHASLPFTVLKPKYQEEHLSLTDLEGRACLLTVYGFETTGRS